MNAAFVIDIVGDAVLAERFKTELRLFKKEQRRTMRQATNIVKADVVSKVQALFPASKPHPGGKGGTVVGPLARKIGTKVFDTKVDVVGLIRPKASAFYGRFQETGLSGSRKTKRGQSPYVLPAKPFLEPVAQAVPDKVTDLLGNSYDVFYTGGA